ncbi:MAG: hypothetical protein AAGA05_12970 [Pseudomonadota bacterium]
MSELPHLALSVRQPWAWAILHGGKIIENRSAGAIRSGGMTTGTICLHAASGMTEAEYQWGVWRLQRHGVTAPRPDSLPRRAIIGTVEVVDIIDRSDSEWFGGEMGLVLENPRAIDPIPAKGKLGYFEWNAGGSLAPVLPWMRAYDRPGGDDGTLPLFPDLDQSFRTDPSKPIGTGRKA